MHLVHHIFLFTTAVNARLIYNNNSETNNDLYLIETISATYNLKPFFIFIGYEKSDSINLIINLSLEGYQSIVTSNLKQIIPTLVPEQRCMFILNINSKESYNTLFETARKYHLFASPKKWLIIQNEIKNNHFDLILDYINATDIGIDSDVIYAYKIDENSNFNTTQIYRVNNEGEFMFEHFIPNITSFKRNNLMRTVLRTCIVVTHNDTLNHLTDYRDKHIDSITKVNYILVQHLADLVNASLVYSIKGTWGYRNNDSTWTGMIGELVENRADIGGTALFVTTDRIDIIDYVAMTTPTRSNFVFREPKLSYVMNVFILPFHWTVWVSIFGLLVATTIGLCVTQKVENRFRSGKNDAHSAEISNNELIMLSIGAACQQGASKIPSKLPGRIVTLFTFVSLMFLYTSYSANIVALLQSPSNSIERLEDLLHSSLSVGVDDTVFNRFYFPTATEPIRRAIYTQKVARKNHPANYYRIDEGVRRLRQGLFAFHMESGSGYKLISETFFEYEKCDLKEIPFLQVPDPWLAVQKNLSYKEILKVGLRKIQESGIQGREVNRIYTRKPHCHGTGNSFVSVTILDTYAACVLYSVGLLLAIIVFLIEIFFKRHIHAPCITIF